MAFTARLQSLRRVFSRLSRVGIFLEVRASATGKRPRVGFTSQPRGDVILIIMCVCIINAVSGMYTLLRVFVLSSLSSHFSFCLLFLPSNPSFITRTFNTQLQNRKENGAIISSSRLPPSRAPFLCVLSFASAFSSSFLLSYIKGMRKSERSFGEILSFLFPY